VTNSREDEVNCLRQVVLKKVVMRSSTMVAKAAVDRRRHRGARSVHLPLRHQPKLPQQAVKRRPPVRVRVMRLSALFHAPPPRESGGQGSSFQGRERPVHLPPHHQLLQQALERRPTPVRVRCLSAREPRLLLQI
jgi:hypothetical protein